MKVNIKKLDLKSFARKQFVAPLSQQISAYEKSAKKLLTDFDLRSKDARKAGKQKVDEFVDQLKKSRGDLETKVRKLVDSEHQRLNKRMGHLLDYLKTTAQVEEKAMKKAAKSAPAKKATPAKAKKKASASKSPAKKAVATKPAKKKAVTRTPGKKTSVATDLNPAPEPVNNGN